MTLPALDLDYPLVTPEPVLTVCPDPAPDNDPFADVLALAADHRARLLAAVPTLIRLARSEVELSRQLVDLAGLVVAAATVGLAVIGHDPRADVLTALFYAVTPDIDALTVAAGLDRTDPDLLLALALEAHS